MRLVRSLSASIRLVRAFACSVCPEYLAHIAAVKNHFSNNLCFLPPNALFSLFIMYAKKRSKFDEGILLKDIYND